MLVDCQQAFTSPIMQQIIRVESGGNPYAIGVVGNSLQRQPRNESEAVATVKMLESKGFNYSIGIGQVNKVHFSRLKWDVDLLKGFNNCHNIVAATNIFMNCRSKAVKAGYSVISDKITNDGIKSTPSDIAALSCYYSGDLKRGTALGYSAKVLRGISMPKVHGNSGVTANFETLMMAE